METCSKCKRHASLPFYVMLGGELSVFCFACACHSAGLTLNKNGMFSRPAARKRPQ